MEPNIEPNIEPTIVHESKATKEGKWYMTVIGGLIGLILGVIPIAACILLFDQLYFICLMFTPVLACLFIRILKGSRNVKSIIYAAVLSVAATLIAGFMLEAGSLVSLYELPWYEILRLTFIMIGSMTEYFRDVWSDLTGDIFNVVFIISYLAIGLMFSWEFIFKTNTKKAVAATNEGSVSELNDSDSSDDDGEYEYVYEDELEADDVTDDASNEIK